MKPLVSRGRARLSGGHPASREHPDDRDLSARHDRLRPHAARPALAGRRAHRVQFVLNYEEGGENNILHGDAASEAFLSEIVGAAALAGQRH